MSDATPTLEQILLKLRDRILNDFIIEIPARVDAYDEDRQCVDAQPLILVARDLEDGEIVHEQLPTIVSAPILYPGAGLFRVTFPIEIGSTVMLRFTSANLSRWLAVGGQSRAIDRKRHNVASAVAYPGGHSFGGITAPNTTVPSDSLVLHAPKLRLGGPDANDPVVRKSDLDTVVVKLNSLIDKYNTHTQGVVGATAGVPSGFTVETLDAPSGSAKTFTE